MVGHQNDDDHLARSGAKVVGRQAERDTDRMAADVMASPVSDRLTVTALLLLAFATGLVDAISVLILGHIFVANMTGNIIFLGFWFVPRAGFDLTAAIVAFVGFLAGPVIGGRWARHLGVHPRRWLTTSLGIEVVLLTALSILA